MQTIETWIKINEYLNFYWIQKIIVQEINDFDINF